MFFKKGVLKNFANFTRKHLCWSLFNKVDSFQACNFIKNRLQYRCFPVKFKNFLEHLFLQNTSGGCFCTRMRNFNLRMKCLKRVPKIWFCNQFQTCKKFSHLLKQISGIYVCFKWQLCNYYFGQHIFKQYLISVLFCMEIRKQVNFLLKIQPSVYSRSDFSERIFP